MGIQQYDVIVVGAGFAGAVAARQFAELEKRVLVLERRNHIGGNAYDFFDNASILVHCYGPHIFHTSDREVFNYLSRFTNWREYKHRVVADIHGIKMPIPFNFTALERSFGEKSRFLEDKLKSTFENREKITINELRQSKDKELTKIGEYVYNSYFDYYSRKQWGDHFNELDSSTFERVPILLSYDNHYFQDIWQGVPEDGYTMMFHRLLNHNRIDLKLSIDSTAFISLSDNNIYFNNKLFEGIVIYTGSIDELFAYRYGPLPYRTLDFSFETYPLEYYQDYGVVNYPVDKDYTRITEYKRLTGQKLESHTTIVKEFPREFIAGKGDIPYYPIPAENSRTLYQRYEKLAEGYSTLYCLGRLAEYRYYNMDVVVANALKLFEKIGRVSV